MLVDWLIRRAQKTPYFHLDGYMERWWIFRFFGDAASDKLTFLARIHHILRSDSDRHFHDHPWPYLTVILRGGYIEHRQFPLRTAADRKRALRVARRAYAFEIKKLGDEIVLLTKRFHGPGSVLWRRAHDRHWLELIPALDAWTLFVMGPKRKPWGFYTETGFVYWRDYPGVSEEEKRTS